jgi:ketosteroid isomerase-like protein
MYRQIILIVALAVLSITGASAQVKNSSNKPMQTPTHQSIEEIKKNIIDLDTQYQLAVKRNDAATMDRILADDFVLVVGSGKTFTKADLLKDARDGTTVYEHQEDTQQTARVWGDTVVITALLWEKGTSDGKSFDKRLWFSDVYKLTPEGWRYVFAQASLALPDKP